MKIIKIDIPKSTDNNDGLEYIKMEKLNNIVLIAGKNGSGKTRILNKIFSTLISKPTKSGVYSAKDRLGFSRKNVISFEQTLKQFTGKLSLLTDQVQIEQTNRDIQNYQDAIKSTLQEIAQLELQLEWKQIETSETSDSYSSVRFVPKSLNLIDCNSFAKNQIMAHAGNISSVGIDFLPNGTFAKIQVIQDKWFNSTHQHTAVSGEEKESAIADYEKLKEIIKIFLNTSIGRTIDGEATLFGFPMGQSNLSDGQKILLQFCIAIYSQETALNDLILILDEPENHLHPSVIIETIERIQKCVSNGQVWIATHSIPLLAHFDPSLIWYVENNKIGHAGKIPEKVLQSLLGNEDEVAKLQDFISLPSQYATSRYALESLFEPGAVLTGSSDPQSFQIRTDLLKVTQTEVLRILDYGAGKGRLISNIVDLDEVNQEKLIEKIDYIAFDKFADDKEYCESALIKAYGTCEKRYFNDFSNLLSVYDKGSFDVVIMCNVLHEIDPKDWLKLFQNEGTISSLLSENGILLLVEDHQIPIGEKAYQKGFLVLDTPQLKELFKISEKEFGFSFTDAKGNGRLKAHKIPKHCLIQIDEKTRLSAIKSMSTTARENILDIRDKDKTYQNGKLHGFWTQQFANAQLNLTELTTQ
ncbi:AAA family ATPase [Sphingobacterium faecium]|uniref:AAA family ATPase n=1 Tax=Sphingobacterium faecium TaxID=34087 RepID=UPI0012923FEF|nr:AAA family ATPase [Sphingobacterium faecium]MQP29812.1 AAA family ATPase [Sphingobacterium faecium]